jgi:hypothetical protein
MKNKQKWFEIQFTNGYQGTTKTKGNHSAASLRIYNFHCSEGWSL